jgi:hypothetical protein
LTGGISIACFSPQEKSLKDLKDGTWNIVAWIRSCCGVLSFNGGEVQFDPRCESPRCATRWLRIANKAISQITVEKRLSQWKLA